VVVAAGGSAPAHEMAKCAHTHAASIFDARSPCCK